MRLRTKLAGAVALVLAAAVVVNAALARQDVARFQPPGALVTVAGHKLHLFCEGAGAPTVILDAGLGGSSLYLRTIQRALKDSVRTCAYDRAGLGWSESGSGQLDVATSANELRELLRASKTPLPTVLVGHSLGANLAEYYAATFGADLLRAVKSFGNRVRLGRKLNHRGRNASPRQRCKPIVLSSGLARHPAP